MKREEMARRREILRGIDASGPDFDAWADRKLAQDARRAVLADRGVRAYRDGAGELSRGLAAARAAVDAEIAADGGPARIAERLAGQVRPTPARRMRRYAVAAILLAAVGLGGLFDLTVLSPAADQARYDVVALDAFNLGLSEEASP